MREEHKRIPYQVLFCRKKISFLLTKFKTKKLKTTEHKTLYKPHACIAKQYMLSVDWMDGLDIKYGT